MEAHPSFISHDEQRDQALAELTDAGVRIVYDTPLTGENPPLAGMGAVATNLCAWPARAQLVSPEGKILEESAGGASAFTRVEIRDWMTASVGDPGVRYWVDSWFARGEARTLYWLYSLGLLGEEDSGHCGGACPVKSPYDLAANECESTNSCS